MERKRGTEHGTPCLRHPWDMIWGTCNLAEKIIWWTLISARSNKVISENPLPNSWSPCTGYLEVFRHHPGPSNNVLQLKNLKVSSGERQKHATIYCMSVNEIQELRRHCGKAAQPFANICFTPILDAIAKHSMVDTNLPASLNIVWCSLLIVQ